MAKNALNELKFGPGMYFYEFYQILEDFWKIFKIGWFLAEKLSFSAFFASWFRNFFFDGNCIRAFKNAQIWLKISILVAYCVFNKANYGFWMILSFGDFMWHQRCQEGRFLSKLTKNGQKWPPWQLYPQQVYWFSAKSEHFWRPWYDFRRKKSFKIATQKTC